MYRVLPPGKFLRSDAGEGSKNFALAEAVPEFGWASGANCD